MRVAAERAAHLGYALVPPAKGDGKYLRLVLDPPNSPRVTLYLDGSRVSAKAKDLRAVAESLPGAVTTSNDVQFPLGSGDLSVLEAFAGRAGAPLALHL